MPPNQAIIDPPLKAFARLFRSMPSKTATSETSSPSSSPREGMARLMNAAAASIPTHAPSLRTRSVRNGRIRKELSERWVALKIPPWFRKPSLRTPGRV